MARQIWRVHTNVALRDRAARLTCSPTQELRQRTNGIVVVEREGDGLGRARRGERATSHDASQLTPPTCILVKICWSERPRARVA